MKTPHFIDYLDNDGYPRWYIVPVSKKDEWEITKHHSTEHLVDYVTVLRNIDDVNDIEFDYEEKIVEENKPKRKIVTTLGDLSDNNWERACELLGLGYWCLNEGRSREDEITLTVDQAREIGIL